MKLTVYLFVPQVTSFIHLFSTHCRTGSTLSAGDEQNRVPSLLEKKDKNDSNICVRKQNSVYTALNIVAREGLFEELTFEPRIKWTNVWDIRIQNIGLEMGIQWICLEKNRKAKISGGSEWEREWPDCPGPFLIWKRQRIIIISQSQGKN